MVAMILNPEGQLMPMNSVQHGWVEGQTHCSNDHRYDGINHPTPGGLCTRCIYIAEGKWLPVPGMPDPTIPTPVTLQPLPLQYPVAAGVSPRFG